MQWRYKVVPIKLKHCPNQSFLYWRGVAAGGGLSLLGVAALTAIVWATTRPTGVAKETPTASADASPAFPHLEEAATVKGRVETPSSENVSSARESSPP